MRRRRRARVGAGLTVDQAFRIVIALQDMKRQERERADAEAKAAAEERRARRGYL